MFAFTGIEYDADCTMALQLSSILGEVCEDECKKETKKAFIIKTRSNNYCFRAENADIMNKWKNEINKLLENIKKNNYTNM